MVLRWVAKYDIIVYNNVSTAVANSSLYENPRKCMEAFDWLAHWHRVMRSFMHLVR